ncbi:snare associated Golgi protein-domain-containing protein, partial [Epithele typhae]|uniref:snare associated Golgi protein-domain-containing protein n=1 Tax=Epithele typhae TaxID=378194 RepID=UPI002008DB78
PPSHSRASSETIAPSDYSHPNYKPDRIGVDYRQFGGRTPSPTPSEAEALAGKTRSCDIRKYAKYVNREWLSQPRNLFTAVVTLIVIGALIAFVALQQTIINALKPASNWLLHTPGAWAIPIGIMIIISFPPLFGHELVAVFTGVVWGPWIGFGITAAGTVLGELCTYFVFKYFCSARAQKQEEKKLSYALTAEVIRQGGFTIAVMVRYSAIPGHLTTAIFATCGMPLWTFLAAAVLSLPKQFAAVYLGYAENLTGAQAKAKHATAIKVAVIALTVLVTLFAMRFINARIDAIKGPLIYRRRKARQARLAGRGYDARDVEAEEDGGAVPL